MRESRKRRTLLKAVGATGLGIGLAGCIGEGSNDSGGAGDSEDPQFDLEAIEPDELVGEGPFGEKATPPDSVDLTDDEVQEIQNGNYNIEIVFHFETDTWVRLQEQAIRKRCEDLGIEVTGVHYPNFDPEQQSNMLETVAQKDNVDGVFSIPVDTEATETAYRSVIKSGKKMVFMDNVPSAFNHPNEYAGVVAADNRAMGVIGGRMMESLVDGGKILLLEFDVPFYVVDERTKGVKSVLEDNDDFQIESYGFTDPGNVLQLAQDALTANPDAAGLWAPWVDAPGAQAIQAIQEQQMNIPVTSCDLGERSAVLMAERSPLKGVGSQNPYQQGITEVNMMGKRLLEKETPPYIAFPSPAVARQNLPEMYEKILREEPPEEVIQHYD